MKDDIEDSGFSEESNDRIRLDMAGENFLYASAKWSRLISIIGFFIVCFLLFFAFYSSVILSYFSTIRNVEYIPALAVSIFYIVLAALYFIPSLYLFQFSIYSKAAIKNNSTVELTKSFSKLKSFFKFWGILMLVIIIFYAIVITLVVVQGMSLMNTMRH